MNNVKVLMIGDVVGKPGRRALHDRLARIKSAHGVDFTVANGENSADGFGIAPAHVRELADLGIDAITTGDHVWDRRELLPVFDAEERLLRPSNYPATVPGHGSAVYMTASGNKIAVLDLQGRVFMAKQILDEPFAHAKREVARLRELTPVIVVDLHGEATSEKTALGWYLDGTVSAVAGTHTHVQTADERILPGGTAYITDLGMTGPCDGVIGLDRDRVIEKFVTQMGPKWAVAKGRVQVNGVVIDVDDKTGQASAIVRVNEVFEPSTAS